MKTLPEPSLLSFRALHSRACVARRREESAFQGIYRDVNKCPSFSFFVFR